MNNNLTCALSGATAGGIEAGLLVWMRTINKYQYFYGKNLSSSVKDLYRDGKLTRFYKGGTFAVLDCMLCKLGDAYIYSVVKNNYSDLEKYIKDSPMQGRHNFAVITDKTKKHIGNCSIYSIKPRIKAFEIGWFIGEKNFRGGHYSSMIIFQLHKKGFVEMNLQKCIGYIDVNHIKARMTNIFSGYKEVGKLIKKKNNQSISLIKIEITKRDWLLNAKKLKIKYPELYEINNI